MARKMTQEEREARRAAVKDMMAEGYRIQDNIVGEPEFTDEDLRVLKLLREFGF